MIVNVLPSLHATHYAVAMHAGVALAVFFSGVNEIYIGLSLLLVALHYRWATSQQHWQAIKYHEDMWWLFDGECWQEFSLFDHSILHDKLIALRFKKGWWYFNVYLWPDAASKRELRHLRILLRHGVDMSS